MGTVINQILACRKPNIYGVIFSRYIDHLHVYIYIYIIQLVASKFVAFL